MIALRHRESGDNGKWYGMWMNGVVRDVQDDENDKSKQVTLNQNLSISLKM